MNCDAARMEIIAYLKDELETGKRRRLEEHLAKCPECRKELEKARKLLTWTEAASDEAIVKNVEEIINNAIAAGASDIHFESQRDDALLVRYRVDGVLQETARFESSQRVGILARVKMLAGLNVAETSIPQDGRIGKWIFREKEYDLRVNSIPYIYGDGIVLRILDKSSVMIGLDKLGFYPEHIEALDDLVKQPNGWIVMSGPTGSGKTTTLYSLLLKLVSSEKKVLSIEDPVEYALSGVNQVQVHSRAGLTFAAALRAFLRHDPDVILVGETRDLETAVITAEAALTGHLMLSSICANDVASTIQHLLELGPEPYILSSTLIGVLAQRLARKVCRECGEKVEVDMSDPTIKFLGITPWDLKEHKIYRGKGCEVCRHTGYKGRTGIYELLTIDRELGILIGNGASGAEVVEAARSKGFVGMREDAKRKVLDGITTPEEAFRVLSWMP